MHAESYSASKFWSKIATVSTDAGCKLIKTAIILFCILTEADISVLARGSIAAALGYFIFPFDVIPDMLPMGFWDDMAILSALLAELYIYLTPEIEERVNDYMPDICIDENV